MRSLLDNLAEVAQKRTAVGHFNISDLVGLNAVVAAARRVEVPVLIGTSEGERAFIGARQAAVVVRSILRSMPGTALQPAFVRFL